MNFDLVALSAAFQAMRTQMDDTERTATALVARRAVLLKEIQEVDAKLVAIARPLAGMMGQQPAAPAPAPAPQVQPEAPYVLGAPTGRLQPPPSLGGGKPTRISREKMLERVIQILPPTTDSPVGPRAISKALREDGIEMDEANRKKLAKVLKDLVSSNRAVPRGEPGPDRKYHRNSSSPLVEAAAFVGPTIADVAEGLPDPQ